MFAGVNVLLTAFVFFLIPETKGVMLEEMDAVFGGANHVEGGGDMFGVTDAHHANKIDDPAADEKEGPVSHIEVKT